MHKNYQNFHNINIQIPSLNKKYEVLQVIN